MMRNYLHYFISLVFLFVAVLSTGSIYAQSKITISGEVTGYFDEELIGVTIIEDGTTNGTVSSTNGSYTINVASEKSTLVFSYMGYRTRSVVVGRSTVIDINLEQDATAMEEVVVIGYGTQTKATLTGALSTVDTKSLVDAPLSSVTNSLAGQMPGVIAIQSTGQPGADAAAIYIRGTGSLTGEVSEPLILVDGVERDFSQIDPSEIESLSVLKDAASTAVFGVRGANGVIIVTTKQGVAGKPKVSFSTNFSLQQPINITEMVGSYEYAMFYNQKQDNDGYSYETTPTRYFSPEAVEAYRLGSDPLMYPDTNWGDYMYNNVSMQTRNNVNISGGSENIKYFVSLGYLYQNGIIKDFGLTDYDGNYRYNRYNYRTNLDIKLSKTTQMKVGIGGDVGNTRTPDSTGINDAWAYMYTWVVPMSSPGVINGVRTSIPDGHIPLEVIRDGFDVFAGKGYADKVVSNLYMNVNITQKLNFITKGLSFNIKGALDNKYSVNKDHSGGSIESQYVYYASNLADSNKPYTDPDFDKTLVYVPYGTQSSLGYSESYSGDRNWYVEAKINYQRSFGKHNVTGLLLYNQSRDYFPSTVTYIPNSYIGYVGRAAYNYSKKYLFDVNVGYNGSENFAPGSTRYGLFPSVSGGWVVTEEPFMQNQKVFDMLKFRVSYGKVGSDKGGSRFLYAESAWSSSGNYNFGTTSTTTTAYGVSDEGNPGVTWATAYKQNYAIDAQMFKERLSLTVDYFYELRTGILTTSELYPLITSISYPTTNIGKVENKGYEVSLTWKDKFNNGFSYSINANVSYAKNKVLYKGEAEPTYAYQATTGKSTGIQTDMYEFVRVYQYSDFYLDGSNNYVLNPDLPQPSVSVYPGDAMYADLNNDGVVNSDDTFAGGYSKIPQYTAGLNVTLGYKGFGLSMRWLGTTNVAGMPHSSNLVPFLNSGNRGLHAYYYDNCWSPTNQSGTVPRAAETSESWNIQTSTQQLQDASYIRLKDLTLSYNIKKGKLLNALGVGSVRITLVGTNLLTFTNLEFLDPENLLYTKSNGAVGGAYPLVKNYSMGLNLNF